MKLFLEREDFIWGSSNSFDATDWKCDLNFKRGNWLADRKDEEWKLESLWISEISERSSLVCFYDSSFLWEYNLLIKDSSDKSRGEGNSLLTF